MDGGGGVGCGCGRRRLVETQNFASLQRVHYNTYVTTNHITLGELQMPGDAMPGRYNGAPQICVTKNHKKWICYKNGYMYNIIYIAKGGPWVLGRLWLPWCCDSDSSGILLRAQRAKDIADSAAVALKKKKKITLPYYNPYFLVFLRPIAQLFTKTIPI